MRRAGFLLVAVVISSCSCRKEPLPQPKAESFMVSLKELKPSKLPATISERLEFLRSSKVKNALEDFNLLKELYPEIVEAIGAIVNEGNKKDLIEVFKLVSNISNNAATKKREDFGLIEATSILDISMESLSKFERENQKTGVLSILLLSYELSQSIVTPNAARQLDGSASSEEENPTAAKLKRIGENADVSDRMESLIRILTKNDFAGPAHLEKMRAK